MKILVTGAAGFIGMYVCERLLAQGDTVVGIDNLNDYYDVALKEARLARLVPNSAFSFHKLDVADRDGMARLFAQEQPQRVIHLAAQAGVRYSLQNPHAYADSNLVGFVNVLEACRHNRIEHLVYASSSSVYGGNRKLPFSEHDNVDHPVSLYAATKKANELMAHTYSHLYDLPTTGLRFFTVYGPWGRPDMAYWKFTAAMLADRPIDIYNHGQMERDFTYIDDIVEGVLRVVATIPGANEHYDATNPNPASSNAPYRIYNIGNHYPVKLMDFIETIERTLGVTARKNFLPFQDGDVQATNADVSELIRAVGELPHGDLTTGIEKFVTWYKSYHGVAHP